MLKTIRLNGHAAPEVAVEVLILKIKVIDYTATP